MKVKVELDISPKELQAFWLDETKKELASLRFKYKLLFWGKFFPNINEIPLDQQAAFAKLYILIGVKNREIRRYEEWEKSYLLAVKKIWQEYYTNIAHSIIHHTHQSRLQTEFSYISHFSYPYILRFAHNFF
jgi:hypothetical protein